MTTVVLDLVLGDDPAALHDALSSREVPTLLISGRDPAALGPLAEVRGWSYAAKPISPQVLRGLVAELLGVDAPAPVKPPAAPVVLHRLLRKRLPMMTGADVRAVQQAAGLTGGDVDGKFWSQTKGAVQRFQRARSLAPDGVVGPLTARAMGLGWDGPR